MATMTSFFLDPAERAECVRNPEAFVFRSERVLGGLVQKLKRTEAKHSVERVDMEQTYHQLERSHAMLREDYQKISTQHAQYGSDRDALIEARDGALGEASKLRGQLRSRDLELSRLKDEAAEAAEERKRLLGANARKAQQLDALEKEVQQLRQQESGSRRSVQDLMGKLAANETASVTTSLQANTQSQQITLLQRRATDADEHAQAHAKLVDGLRKQLAETSAEASATQAFAPASARTRTHPSPPASVLRPRPRPYLRPRPYPRPRSCPRSCPSP